MIKKLLLEKADRIYHLPPLLDDFLPRRERRKMLGREIIDLARFEWPSQPSDKRPETSARPVSAREIADLSEKTAAWYKSRFGARIHPIKEIYIGGSIRQILNLLSLSYLNPGDMALIPDPGVWHYRAAAVLASAETVPYYLNERSHFKPAVSSLPGGAARTAKAMILNSPHNPTGAVLTKDDMAEILHLAGRENLLLILDQAFDGFIDGGNPSSLFSLPGGRKAAVELYSYAYNFGRPLPSCAFAVAQPAIIAALRRTAEAFAFTLNSHHLQGALEACADPKTGLDELKQRFAQNRLIVDQLCGKLRLVAAEHRIGPFYWAKLPGRKQSRRFCRVIYRKGGILAVPGIVFGENGEGFVRFSLTGEADRYQKSLEATRGLIQSITERKAADG